MKKLINWLKSFRSKQKLLHAVDAKINRVLSLSASHDQKLTKSLEKIKDLEQELLDEIEKVKYMAEQSQIVSRKLEEALDAARDELQTCRDIVIPGLVSANSTFQSAWDAQAAHNALMQVAAQQQKAEE